MKITINSLREFGCPALTVLEPWATSIADGSKPVENRTWAPPAAVLGRRILIHAGKSDRLITPDLLAELAPFVPSIRTMGEFALRGDSQSPDGFSLGHVVCVARVVGCVPVQDRPSDCRWSSGPLCWILEDVVRVTPFAIRGAQQVFYVRASSVPDEVLALLAA